MEELQDGAENNIEIKKKLEEEKIRDSLKAFPNLMGTADVNKATGLSINTLFLWRKNKMNLNFIRRGGKICYMKETIIRYLLDETTICA